MAWYDFLKQPRTYAIAAGTVALTLAVSYSYIKVSNWISPPAIRVPSDIPVVRGWLIPDKNGDGKPDFEYVDRNGKKRLLILGSDNKTFESVLGAVDSFSRLEERLNNPDSSSSSNALDPMESTKPKKQ